MGERDEKGKKIEIKKGMKLEIKKGGEKYPREGFERESWQENKSI